VDFRIPEPAVKGEICSIHGSTVKGRRATEYSIGYKAEGCKNITKPMVKEERLQIGVGKLINFQNFQ
jgi:hypothetical protein